MNSSGVSDLRLGLRLGLGGVAYGADVRPVAFFASAFEHGRACDKNVGAGFDNLPSRLGRYAAIDFDIDRARADERLDGESYPRPPG